MTDPATQQPAPFTHIVSATGLTSGEELAMCGHVFESYRAAVDAGHKVGNYTPLLTSFSDGHARGIDCEACIIRHMKPVFA